MKAFLMYIDDWRSSKKIHRMDAHEERGYLRLLLYAASEEDCGLPDDDRELANISLLGSQWFRATKDKNKRFDSRTSGEKLRECFFAMADRPGRLYNARLLKEFEYQQEVHDKASERGKRGAQKRWGGAKSDSTSNACAMPAPLLEHCLSSSNPNPNPNLDCKSLGGPAAPAGPDAGARDDEQQEAAAADPQPPTQQTGPVAVEVVGPIRAKAAELGLPIGPATEKRIRERWRAAVPNIRDGDIAAQLRVFPGQKSAGLWVQKDPLEYVEPRPNAAVERRALTRSEQSWADAAELFISESRRCTG